MNKFKVLFYNDLEKNVFLNENDDNYWSFHRSKVIMDSLSQERHVLRKNPSREKCQQVIRRILMTETLERGKNEHFKSATDFLGYFESLYPASPSLTKQIQRAVKAMDLPKDEDGFFIINKTKEQINQEEEIARLLSVANAKGKSLKEMTPVFISMEEAYAPGIMKLISQSVSFKDKYEVMVQTHEGILFYTDNEEQLRYVLDSVMPDNNDN